MAGSVTSAEMDELPGAWQLSVDVVRVMQSVDYSMKGSDGETTVMDSRPKTYAGKLHNYTFNIVI